MAIDILNFPGYYDREIDLTPVSETPVGVPAGLIGSAERGPAFLPVSLASMNDFEQRFGDINPRYLSTYAADIFLANRNNLTFTRVLGAGSNQTVADIENTRLTGTVKNAGFYVSGSVQNGVTNGCVQFLIGQHALTSDEGFGFPSFTLNDSFNAGSVNGVHLVRGVVMMASGARMQLLDINQTYLPNVDDYATPSSTRLFKIAISSSQGVSFGNDDGNPGVHIVTASFDPSSDNYFAKVLNTDPERFQEYGHYVYADYAVDESVAVLSASSTNAVAVVSGSAATSATSGDPTLPFLQGYGRFDARYQTAQSPWFISQPFGTTEYDLFQFECLDDGQYPNDQIKISIANLQASSNPRYLYGSFTVLVRRFDDNDFNQQILEQFTDCNLDPESDNYIAKKIGDIKYFYNFDAENPEDRRMNVTGRFASKSKYIRVVMDSTVERKELPETVLPFGFRGPSVLNTNPLLADYLTPADVRLDASGSAPTDMLNAIVPPVPFVFKATRGPVSTAGGLFGAPGSTEVADSRVYWGVKFGKIDNALNPNITTDTSPIIKSFTKFAGIEKLDTVVTSSYTDLINDNKFTLARVALGNTSLNDVTASVNTHIRESAYIRNGQPDGTEYKIVDPADSVTERITFATLLQKGANATVFNRFSQYAKFTTPVFGGFDGTNILDKHDAILDDRSTSQETRGTITGHANVSHVSPGFYNAQAGTGNDNSTVNSYKTAIDLNTDPFIVNTNVLAIPGQRDSLVTDYAIDKVTNYDLAVYLIDIPSYDPTNGRIFDGDTGVYIDVENTANAFELRALDTEYAAPYYPDIKVVDKNTTKKVTLPASVAALGAIGYNDKTSYPWFAPAGFNRASLDFVDSTVLKLKQSSRERLYGIDINPIVKFPGEKNYVIFAQETLKKGETSLAKLNVMRMLLDVKRQCTDRALKLIFEPMESSLYKAMTKAFTEICGTVQNRGGIAAFKVICDETNNTENDLEEYRIHAQIYIKPIGAVEFVTLDLIITRNGVLINVV